jgi:Tfp pilus assembly major pilin PilA
MFKKKENGFSLVELSVAAAVAVGLAVVAVSVVSGTAASVSAKGSSAASVESCTISESLAKAGGDVAAINCAGTSAAASASAEPTGTTGFFTFAYNGVQNGELGFTVTGANLITTSGYFFNEAQSSWSTQRPVLSLSLSGPGAMSNGGWYVWDYYASSANQFYGSGSAVKFEYSDKILLGINSNNRVSSVHVFFAQNPTTNNWQPAYQPEWSAYNK